LRVHPAASRVKLLSAQAPIHGTTGGFQTPDAGARPKRLF